jgi:hypothetical protein
VNRARLLWCAAACTLALTLTACGDGATTDPTVTSATTLKHLRADVLALSNAAAARDYAAAASALDTLTADLADARATGNLNETKAAQIRAAADAVRSDLSTALSQPTVTPATTTESPRPAKTKHHGNGDGHGKGG